MLTWIRRSFRRSRPPLSDTDQARQLIAAIDRGGIPLDPARVNAIARNLGLDAGKARLVATMAGERTAPRPQRIATAARAGIASPA